MREQNNHSMVTGILAGVAGGLVASWVMNEFMEDVGPRVQKAIEGEKPSNGKLGNGKRGNVQRAAGAEPPREDATMKTADAIVSTLSGGRHLSYEGKKKGGPVVHYAFGAVMGGVYGALAERVPSTTAGFGTGFGSALFAGADLLAVPALHLSQSNGDEPVSSLATPFAAHLVYGLTTEAVRRLVRALL